MTDDRSPLPDRGFDADEETAAAVETLATAADVAGDHDIPVDDLFRTLSHPGRRYVLTYLLRSEGFVTCRELVDHVVRTTEPSMTDSEFRKRVAADLTHTHLPALADLGLVEYSMERQIVLPTDRTALVEPYVRLALAQEEIAGGASE